MAHMSPFEALMIICFGAAWPFSIFKSYHSRKTGGKSVVFLYVVLLGYVSGCIHKLRCSMDPIIWLYALNGVMVSIDIFLFYRNRFIERRESAPASAS